MHGGAPGSGAPPGNKNALKHGQYTRKALAQLKMLLVIDGLETVAARMGLIEQYRVPLRARCVLGGNARCT
jgi:hypothetical protein